MFYGKKVFLQIKYFFMAELRKRVIWSGRLFVVKYLPSINTDKEKVRTLFHNSSLLLLKRIKHASWIKNCLDVHSSFSFLEHFYHKNLSYIKLFGFTHKSLSVHLWIYFPQIFANLQKWMWQFFHPNNSNKNAWKWRQIAFMLNLNWAIH